jgi:DNA adenine methylase
MVPLSQLEFERAATEVVTIEVTKPNVRAAVNFFVKIRMSRGGHGIGYVVPTTRLRRGINEQVSAWLNAVDGLADVHSRLSLVEILSEDATKVIPRYDSQTTLFYSDPPYLHSTRVTTHEYGANEMSEREHAMLLGVYSKSTSPVLTESQWNDLSGSQSYSEYASVSKHKFRGLMMLSGYKSDLYSVYAKKNGWTCLTREIPNSASSKAVKPKMTECLWVNFEVKDQDWITAVKGCGEVIREK